MLTVFIGFALKFSVTCSTLSNLPVALAYSCSLLSTFSESIERRKKVIISLFVYNILYLLLGSPACAMILLGNKYTSIYILSKPVETLRQST